MIGPLLRMNSPFLSDVALLGLRLALGLSILFGHGLVKLQNFSERGALFADPFGFGPQTSMGLAIFAEVFCSILLVLGAVTRLSVIPLIVTMATAFFFVHSADDWKTKELAFVYLLSFSAIFLLGPGRFSVDGLLLKSKN